MMARCALALVLCGLAIASSAQETPTLPDTVVPGRVSPGAGSSGASSTLGGQPNLGANPSLAPNFNPYGGGGDGYAGNGGYGNNGYGDGGPNVSWSSDAIATDGTRVGPYGQPAWTTQRPFAASRVYVLPPGQMQVEQWVRPTWKRDGTTEFRFLEEYAVGLPGRFQLDIYERWNIEPNGAGVPNANHEGVQIELRWAFANWGVIPLNPTLYAEWVERGGRQEKPNKYEIKLLLADEIISNWYYASNLILEQEVSGEKETELGWSHAISHTIIERKLLAGMELLYSYTTVEGRRSDGETNVGLGPSLQWRPTNRTFLTTAALFGCTEAAPVCQMYVIFGFQFGTRAGPMQGYRMSSSGRISGPASTIGN